MSTIVLSLVALQNIFNSIMLNLLDSLLEWEWLLITLAMAGKMCITASYGVIYIFSTESFPTVVRNSGM